MKEPNSSIDNVVNGSITISGLLAGFMLLFIGLIVNDTDGLTLIRLISISVAMAFLEFFYRAMVKSWNLLAIRTMSEIGDKIIKGELKNGPNYAAFRALWSFQPKLFQGSWILLLVISLYCSSKSIITLPYIIGGFLLGLIYYSITGERRWRKTWERCSKWDKAVMLGENIKVNSLPFHQRIFSRFFYPSKTESNFDYSD